MALASLTVDLTLALSKFEADSGRAAQVVVRDSERMSAGARAFEKQLQRMADQAGRTQGQFLALRAAELGLGENTQAARLIEQIERQGTASTAASAAQVAGTKASSAAAESAATKERALQVELLQSVRAVNTAYEARKAQLIEQEKLGKITPQQLTIGLTGLGAERTEGIQRLKEEASLQSRAIAQLRDKEVAAEKASAEAKAAADRFIQSLEREANALGKTRSALLLEEAARRGVTEQVRPFVDRIAQAETRLNTFARTGKLTAFEVQQLGFQVHDLGVQLASGQNPLVAFIQQGSQLSGTFGGTGNALRALVSTITPARVAFGGAAAAAGAFFYAIYHGAQQTKQANDALVLTGNYAGQTAASITSLSRQIAVSGQVTVTAARETAVALAATGEIGPRVFSAAAQAATLYGQATGKTAKEVATEFASMGADVAKWAADHNKQLNFITAAQYDQIKSLQEQGRAAEAQGIVYDALTTRLQKLDTNLGYLDRALRTVKGGWASFWDAAFDIGRPETIEDRIARAAAAAVNAQERIAKGRATLPAFSSAPALREQDQPGSERAVTQQQARAAELRDLLRQKFRQDENTFADAERADATKRAIDGKLLVDTYTKTAKAASEYAKALAELNRAFKANEEAGTPISERDKADALAGLAKKFRDSRSENEANQVAKAERDRALKAVQDSLKEERAAYEFQGEYLSKLYAAGEVSLETFYKARRDATDRDLQEQLNTIDEQIAIQKRYLEAIKGRDPSEAINAQKNIDTLNEEAARIVVERQRRVTLANQEEKDGYRQLTNSVLEYRAQLAQLEGDEEKAARLRAQIAIANARVQAGQSGGQISEADLDRQRRALELAGQFAEVQRRVGLVTSDAARAEELYLLLADQSEASLLERDREVYAIRAKALDQLGQLAASARAVTRETSDPKIKAFAEDLALQYAKAADSVDPALNRLRESGKELGSNLANDFERAFLSADKLSDLLPSIAKSIQAFAIKTLVTQPLEQFLQNGIRALIDGRAGGNQGAGLSSAAGAGAAAAAEAARAATLTAAQTAQTSALVEATVAQSIASSSLEVMSTEAFKAAAALAAVSSSGTTDAAGNIIASLFGGSGGVDFAANPFAAVALADGTNRVPYDGMPAILHKDEAVVPAKYNPAVGGRAPGAVATSITVNNYSGAEVETHDRGNGNIEMIIKAAKREVIRDMRAGGSVHDAMVQTYGVGRRLARRD